MPRLPVPTTPTWQRHRAIPPDRFRLIPFRSPLLRESQLLSFPRGTEMFQFPRFPLPVLCVQTGVTPYDGCRVSPFGHPRIEAWSAAPRGFSQPPTSFIGFRRQGIHRWLFIAWRKKDARARYAILKRRRCGPQRGPAGSELASGRRVTPAWLVRSGSKCSQKTEQRDFGNAWPRPSAERPHVSTTKRLRRRCRPVINWESPVLRPIRSTP